MNKPIITKISTMEIKPPKKKAFTIETDPDFIKLHTLCLASGKRGGGKSVAIANLIKKAKDKGYYDKVFLVTPTYHSNKEIWDIADINEEDVYEPDVDVLKKIIKIVEAEREEWDQFQENKKMFTKFNNEMKTKTLDHIDEDDLMYYYENGLLNKDTNTLPKWKYRKEEPPKLAVILDDTMGTDLMKPSGGLTNFCIKHRHIGKGLGISVFMLVQSYCSREGVARPIRENCTHLLLFKCKDEAQIKKIHSEVGADVDLDKFNQMFQYSTADPFCFLFVDFSPKEPSKTFRRCFNEYLN
jgi:hypothetical protein|tara:strand:+ start:46 stop:939 length:894 start_codon:yes stop_codon:yes gene_type:complete